MIRRRRRTWRVVSALLKYALLLFLAAFVSWVWVISTSLKNPGERPVYPIIWIPDPVRWDNYLEAFRHAVLALSRQHDVGCFSIRAGRVCASNALVAYGFQDSLAGAGSALGLLLATLILPGFVTFIPLYLIFKQLNWINSYLPLVVPTFFGNPFFVFLLRQFFMSLPEEFAGAPARVDGASELRIFLQIILPLSRPALAVVALFQFIGSWNDYFGPLIYINDKALYTISLGIANIRASYGFSNFAWIMAATCMSVLPIILLFFFAQRTFIEGIALSGLKG